MELVIIVVPENAHIVVLEIVQVIVRVVVKNKIN